MFKSLAKRLPHPLLCRLYHHVHLREEATRAAKAASRAGLPLFEITRSARIENIAKHCSYLAAHGPLTTFLMTDGGLLDGTIPWA